MNHNQECMERTIMSTEFSGHTELDNPYELERNSDLEMKKGYGVAIGSAFNNTKEICSNATERRTFVISFARRISATRMDSVTRIATEKLLMEDHFALMKYFEEHPELAP